MTITVVGVATTARTRVLTAVEEGRLGLRVKVRVEEMRSDL